MKRNRMTAALAMILLILAYKKKLNNLIQKKQYLLGF